MRQEGAGCITMPEILLVTINAKWIHPSLALRLLKANLGDIEEPSPFHRHKKLSSESSAPVKCEILEFALRQPLREKVEPILAARPRILGFSVSVWNHLATLELLKALEESRDRVPSAAGRKPVVVLGGPEVSWLPEEAEIFQYADYVIRGEGEESFRSLCRELLSGKNIAGPPETGNPVFINRGSSVVDLNNIAPAYNLYTDEDLHKKLIYVEASRGCPFCCEFCQGGMHKVREFPLGSFLAEMGTLIDRGGRQFKFLDRTFNLNIERAVKIMEFFLDRISAAKDSPPCVHFEMVPSLFSPELKEMLRRFPAGSLRLELGIQTFNPDAAVLIRRAGDRLSAARQSREALETLEFLRRETNALLHVDLIAGLPGEDGASFGAGFDRLWQTLSGGRAFEIQPGILKCLPGTTLSRHNDAYGMKYSPLPPYEVIETACLSAGELSGIKNFARFWETIVNRGSFAGLVSRLVPPGEPVFNRFMGLSDRLLEKFGRNWGIGQAEMKLFLEE